MFETEVQLNAHLLVSHQAWVVAARCPGSEVNARYTGRVLPGVGLSVVLYARGVGGGGGGWGL